MNKHSWNKPIEMYKIYQLGNNEHNKIVRVPEGYVYHFCNHKPVLIKERNKINLK